jgi:hypothetical protein
MSGKIVRLSDITHNCLQVSPKQAIGDLQDFMVENPDFDKVFVMAVNTKNEDFKYAWWKGKLYVSETITALHLALADQIEALR